MQPSHCFSAITVATISGWDRSRFFETTTASSASPSNRPRGTLVHRVAPSVRGTPAMIPSGKVAPVTRVGEASAAVRNSGVPDLQACAVPGTAAVAPATPRAPRTVLRVRVMDEY